MPKVNLAELIRRGKERFPERKHHPLCPWRPGEVLEAGTVCTDCIYGVIKEREQRGQAN